MPPDPSSHQSRGPGGNDSPRQVQGGALVREGSGRDEAFPGSYTAQAVLARRGPAQKRMASS